MKTILYTTLCLLLVGLTTVPGVAADHDDPICYGPACVDPCLSVGFCVDPGDPKGTLTGAYQAVKDLFGPCTCDPVD